MPIRLIHRFLDTNGDGSGDKNAVGDYSGEDATIFYLQSQTIQSFLVTQMIIHVEDAGEFDTESYGSGIELTNGIVVVVRNDNDVLLDLTDGVPIFTNAHWGRHCYNTYISDYGQGNVAYLQGIWRFFGAGLPIFLANDERLEVILNDDFSGLREHYFMAQGYRY